MLGTFSQRLLTRGNFPRVFWSGNFPTVQFPKRQLPKSLLAAAPGLLVFSSHIALVVACSSSWRKLPLGIFNIWEVAAWKIVSWIVRRALQVGFLGQNKIRKCYFKISLGSLNILYVLIKRLCHLLWYEDIKLLLGYPNEMLFNQGTLIWKNAWIF